MYVTLREKGREPGRRGARSVGPVVLLLGLTSLVTDISSEMVVAALPFYLTAALGLSPLGYAFIDSLYQGVTAVVRVASGFAADRWHRPKLIAALGYGLSAASRFALVPARGLDGIGAAIAADRIGKGIRTAPRDALISYAAPPGLTGRAFGVHRSLDTIGALAGPLVATALLLAIPNGFSTVFVVSGCIGIVGLAILLLFVPNPALAADPSGQRLRFRNAGSVAAGAPLRSVLMAAGLLGAVTVGDGLLYLVLQQREGFDIAYGPLLFVGTALTYLLLAVPIGSLADRIGARKVFVAGYLPLLLAYLAALGVVPGIAGVVACVLLLGVHYAATDGVLSALAAALLPEGVRSTGLAWVQTVVALGRMSGTLVFGWVWSVHGPSPALMMFGAALVAVVPLAAWLLRLSDRTKEDI